MIIPYKNLDGNSQITSYEIGPNYIKLKFQGKFRVYFYTYKKAGVSHVERMKELAEEGRGLGSYVNKYMSDLYE